MAQDFSQNYPIQRSENIWLLHTNWLLLELCKQLLHGTDLIDRRIETLTQYAEPTNTRFDPNNSRYTQEGRRPFPNNCNYSRSASPGRKEQGLRLSPTEASLAGSTATYLFHQEITVFQRPQNRNERPNTPTQTYEQRFPKTNDMGRSNTVQLLETDYSVADFCPLNY